MSRIVWLWSCSLSCLLGCASLTAVHGDEPESKGTIDLSTLESNAGFQSFFWDDAEGKVWLELQEFDEPFLYVSSLVTGLGSNPVGLDRGQIGGERVVFFKRVGKQVFLVQPNLKYRATTDSEPEREAIRESFAESILWAGELKRAHNGVQIVDMSSFLMRDAHDCIGTLASSGQGTFTLDADRSYVHLPRTKAFPDNTEFEVALTFQSDKPGSLARNVAADGKSITLRQRHSFVRLPDGNYRPRKFDPRAGCFSVDHADYGVPIDQPVEQRWITRHRLEKLDPSAAVSSAKEPIVYYLDPGVPQPVRDALLEGASWWNEAFESAGFQDAFQVKVLPADADPMDVRYNVIQWVHRATRGWSYGQSVIDPRTGEIIKGHVLLGSLRVRQDYLLFEGLAASDSSTFANRACGCDACGMGMAAGPMNAFLTQLDTKVPSLDVALARIRQLSAHEVGHTLGFAHNFAASTYGDRASVMDYPSPRVNIVDGKIDLSDAYGTGIGEWDKFTVQYAYSQFAPEQEAEQLADLVEDALSREMLYITDADARPAGAAHPLGNLWDNGSEPVAALQHELEVRRIALASFDDAAIGTGQPLSELEKSLVPVYLHHRYQVDATAKMIGGFEYTYAVKGDGQVPQAEISAERQRAALQSLLATLEPETLVIPQRILDLIPPRVGASASDRERFASQSDPIFDPVSAMRAAAELTLGNLLQPQRANRLARHADPAWGLLELIDLTTAALVESSLPESAQALEARRIVQAVFVDKLIGLAEARDASGDTRAIAANRLFRLNGLFKRQGGRYSDGIEKAHLSSLSSQIERSLQRAAPFVEALPSVELPPGSPIGAGK